MKIESPEAQILADLAPLYVELRNAALAEAPDISDEKVNSLWTALGESPSAASNKKEPIVYLLICMQTFNRIDFARTEFSRPTGRRESLRAVYAAVERHANGLRDTLNKLLDDTMLDLVRGSRLDLERFAAARDLYNAMRRGWLIDIDPRLTMGVELSEQSKEMLPAFDMGKPIPALRGQLSSLKCLSAQARQNREKLTPHEQVGRTVDRNRDAFIVDLSHSFTILTGEQPTSWETAGSQQSARFTKFLQAIWSHMSLVPFHGHWVSLNGKPNAKTVSKILPRK